MTEPRHEVEAGQLSQAAPPAPVQILPEALANQIAAGEVVERPASVVKELIENALDAGATRILIDIEEAGRGLVRVVDDGLGMGPSDATLAVMRHATSKVRTAEDLTAIGTLGFRGEALPSIASVSRFTLVTRRAEDEAATAVHIEGGAAPAVSAAAAPVGTRVEVRDLFWNVPARLKFLKTDQTELHHIVELVRGFALGYPHIHFRLGTGARVALDFPAVRRLFERIVQVLGAAAGKHLFEVHLESAYARALAQGRAAEAESAIRVTGFVSNAREAKATQSGMTTFVNGRRVKDRTMAHAIVSAFGSELAPGRFPQAVLWVHIDPADVDVNVHPAKSEVRFRQPQVVHDAVMRAVQGMLMRRPWANESPLPLERVAQGLAHTNERHSQTPLLSFAVAEPTARSARPGHDREATRPAAPVHRTELRFGASPLPIAGRPVPAASPAETGVGERWRLVGRGKGVVFVEGADGVALFEPQALFEAMTRSELLELARPVASQPLLLPARLDLGAIEAQRLGPRLAALATLGVHIEPFGGTTHQLLGLPQSALFANPSLVLAELAALAARGGLDDQAAIALLARSAARAAIERGIEPQLQSLVDFVPRALATRTAGLFLLSRAEMARRFSSEMPASDV